jgi:hypothetical protein
MERIPLGHRLSEFFGQVFSEWGSAVTGGLSAPLFIWAIAYSSGAPRIVAMTLAVVCIYVAAFRVWKREREAREKERETFEAELAKNSLPEIVGEITSVFAQPAKPSGIGENMFYAGSHFFRFALFVRNVRAVETNIAHLKFEAFDTDPALGFFDVSTYSRQDATQEKNAANTILKRGILTGLEVTAYAKFPENYIFPDSRRIEFSSLEALLTDGFGGTHRIKAKNGLKLWVLEDS